MCGPGVKEFTMPEGKITSPDGLAWLNCRYRIKVDINKRILVKFGIYHTEAGHDIIVVNDGPGILSHTLYRLSGIDKDPQPFLSSTNYLYIKYTTNRNSNYPGFELKYFAVDSNRKN